MTREEHLKYCKVCENKGYDTSKGIICKLTEDIADFEYNCPNFKGEFVQEIVEEKKEPKLTNESKLNDVIRYFIPREGFYIAPLIALCTTLIFIVMVISGVHFFLPEIEDLIKWGANFKVLTLDGEYWRLFTNCFVHIGIIHLLVNMYALIIIGLLLEKIIGKFKFLIAYVVAGITGSVISLWWHEAVVSAGASGAIFGMYGLYVVLFFAKDLRKKTNKNLLISTVVFIAYNLLYGMNEGIDNAAHIGGLIAGILIGVSLLPAMLLRFKSLLNHFIFAFGSITVFVFSIFILLSTPNTIGSYKKVMEEFTLQELEALSRYPSKFNSEAVQLNDIYKGLPYWYDCKNILKKADSIPDLPSDLKEINCLMDLYCDYRIKSYLLMAQNLELKTKDNDLFIFSYNYKINLILKKISGEDIPDSLYIIESEEDKYGILPKNMLYIVDKQPIDNVFDIDFDHIKHFHFMDNDDKIMSVFNVDADQVIVIMTEKAYE